MPPSLSKTERKLLAILPQAASTLRCCTVPLDGMYERPWYTDTVMKANSANHPRPRARRPLDPLGAVVVICGLFLVAPASGDSYGLSMFGVFLMFAGLARLIVRSPHRSHARRPRHVQRRVDGTEDLVAWPYREVD